MSNALEVRNLGKQYYYGSNTSAMALRDVIDSVFWRTFKIGSKDVAKSIEQEKSKEKGKFWALNDVSFDIKFGEVVAIMGRNGAGKSALLKILARVSSPTKGTFKTYGTLGALLEVGTGFNSELTGYENIYLNGALLGMDKNFIKRHLDEIIDFAEIEQFLNTPIKFYSTGMRTRLAFAIAAHLNPDIFIADEVLAVGDSAFQKKCLEKMEALGREGRAVIFVSHNMTMVKRLCDRGIFLEKGNVISDGPVHEVAAQYVKGKNKQMVEMSWPEDTAPGDDTVLMTGIRLVDKSNTPQFYPHIYEDHWIEIDYIIKAGNQKLFPNIRIYNDGNSCVFSAGAWWNDLLDQNRGPGHYRARAKIPKNILNEGYYTVFAAINDYDTKHFHVLQRESISFHISDNTNGQGARGDYLAPIVGVVRPLIEWDIEKV